MVMPSIYSDSIKGEFDDMYECSDNQASRIDDILENLPLEEQISNNSSEMASAKKAKAKQDKRLYCYLESCRKVFTQYCSRQKHERLHRGEKPYVCDVCQYAFTQISNLKRHLLFHSGEKPFSCDHCPKTFRNLFNLKQHMQIHDDRDNRSKHVCTLCSKPYFYIASLRKHMKGEHGGKVNIVDSGSEADLGSSTIENTNEFPEPNPKKMVKVQIVSEDGKLQTVEVEPRVKEDEIQNLPKLYQDILSSEDMMSHMKSIVLESVTQGSTPMECFKKISHNLSECLKKGNIAEELVVPLEFSEDLFFDEVDPYFESPEPFMDKLPQVPAKRSDSSNEPTPRNDGELGKTNFEETKYQEFDYLDQIIPLKFAKQYSDSLYE